MLAECRLSLLALLIINVDRYGSRAAINTNIRGDHCGNTGSHNITDSGNTTTTTTTTTHIHYNQPLMSSLVNYTKISQCLYTSQYERHRNRIREPVEGTCTWVTKHSRYEDWLGNNTSGLLWLSADPGCGKSVIASFLVKHLESQTDAIICYFFFKDDNDEQKSAAFALCAILHQLFAKKRSLCSYAEEAFEGKGKRFTEEVDTLWSILVKAVSEGGCGDVICVVDALDECEEVTKAQLIGHLANLSKSQSSDVRLKLLVTSRPYHKIERVLGSCAATIRLKGEDEINSIAADVTRVVDEGISNLEKYWGRPGGLGYLRDLLMDSADRTFIWVSLVLDILRDSEDDSPEEFTKIVSNAPRDLAELYTKILDKSTYPDKARRVLTIVVAAARPLTLPEMNVAFKLRQGRRTIKDLGDLPPEFARTVKNLCGHFVRIVDSKVYLVHQTAREFLLESTSPGQGNWQYTLCHKDSNYALADICISYLSLEEFEDDRLLMRPYGGINGNAVANYLQKYVFLDYAAQHWADHFRDSQDQQMGLFESTRLICGAGSNRFWAWLRVYWFNFHRWFALPEDWTHLMAASWLGQGAVVERLLGEGGDINARSKQYGTILNMAAVRRDTVMARMLMDKNVNAYIGGKEYNILQLVSEQDQPRFWDESIVDFQLAGCCRK
ncbi:NACHT-ANK domain protein transcript variant 4 [Tuber magnatum]|uniref:NACHT-ANK domain protein transcript variant 4 n=1 Tax=Tuber magnatum TaxID=42249 RepID=A0A317SU90_9PEZI|nr:NACHT-ANK domain protein transcript variant 4 [Tuber magnatum]